MTKIMAHSLRSFAGFCMGEFEKFSPEGTLYPLLGRCEESKVFVSEMSS